MSGVKRFFLVVLMSCALGLTAGTTAASPLTGCTDSGFYSKARFITDLCWTCFFPIKLMGFTVPLPPTRGHLRAPGNTAFPFCACPGRTGIPSLGITWGMWFPTHTIEVTRQPWCSPTLFGIKLLPASTIGGALSAAILQGTPGQRSSTGDEYRDAFYNFHWMSFPLGEMVDTLTNTMCSKIGIDMDYLYLTEFDPTWANEMLALYTHPEIKLFTKIYAHAVCSADAVASTVARPMETAFWCAGSWGMLYPFAGVGEHSNNPESQFLTATKGIAAMHRRGLAKLTYKQPALCADMFFFVMPKQQYQLQNMWPWPDRKQAQWIGASAWRWGMWRNAPAAFEDRVITQWTYKECCITFW